MFTQLASFRSVFALGVVVVALFVAGFAPANAETNNVSSLQATLLQLQEKLQALESYRTGLASGGAAIPSCALLTRNLQPGATDATTGGEVTKLQERLAASGHFTYGKPTGYYGPATIEAVQRWQSANGIVSSGTPGTTGFGAFGPTSRAKLTAECASVGQSDPQKTSPVRETFTTSVSDLRATVKFTLANGCAGYVINWGDGNKTTRDAAPAGSMCTQALENVTQARTYRTAGTYTITVERYSTGTTLRDTSSKKVTVGASTDTCESNGTAYPEGTKKSEIVLPDGTTKRIVDATFVCRSGEWKTVGSLPTADGAFSTSVSDLRATVKFTLPNSCAGYVINWGDGNKTTRDAAAAGTACTEVVHNVTQSRTYRTAGTYTITVERTSGTATIDTQSKTITVGKPAVSGCTSGDIAFPEGATATQITLADGTKKTVADAQFVCRSGEWKIEGSLPPAPVTRPDTTACMSGGTSYPEGTKRTQITENGQTRTIADAQFVCRGGEWKIEGSLPTADDVTPAPATSCTSGGVVYREGTERTSITNADGTMRRISDGVFVCRSGQWVIEGSLPQYNGTPSGSTGSTNAPTYTATVSGLTATLKFSIPNACAGYTLTWGNGIRTTRAAQPAGTMCTQAVVNLEKAHTYAAAGTYTVTLTRYAGETVIDKYAQNITVSAPSVSTGSVRGAATTQLDEVMKELVNALTLLQAKLAE